MIVGVVFVQDADRFEIVRVMEADRGIAQFPVGDRREVVGGVRIGAPPLGVARHAPAEHDALQAEMFAQCAPRLVQPLADAQPPVAGIDADLHAVEPVAVRIVARGKPVAGDFVPAVRRHRRGFVDNEGRAVADDLAVELGDELAVGKGDDLAAYHALGVPGRRRVYPAAERRECRPVAQFRGTDGKGMAHPGAPGRSGLCAGVHAAML